MKYKTLLKYGKHNKLFYNHKEALKMFKEIIMVCEDLNDKEGQS